MQKAWPPGTNGPTCTGHWTVYIRRATAVFATRPKERHLHCWSRNTNFQVKRHHGLHHGPQAPFLAHVLLIPSKLALFSRHFKQSWWEGSALLALPCLTWRSGPLLCMVWCLPSKDGHICLLTLPALCEENVPSWSSDEDRFCRLERDPMDLGCPSSLAHYLLTSHPTQIHEDTPCSETNTFCAPHEDALL